MRRMGQVETPEQRQARIDKASERRLAELLEKIEDAEEDVKQQKMIARWTIIGVVLTAGGQVVDQMAWGRISDFAIISLSVILWILFLVCLFGGAFWYFVEEVQGDAGNPRARLRLAQREYRRFITGQTSIEI